MRQNNYKKCICCGLLLPISIMRPIPVKHQGKIIIVGICDNCRERKEKEAKQQKEN